MGVVKAVAERLLGRVWLKFSDKGVYIDINLTVEEAEKLKNDLEEAIAKIRKERDGRG